MKTLRLSRAESTAYANGERRFWRAMRKQPSDPLAPWPTDSSCICWDDFIEHVPYYVGCGHCPYGTPGDRIEVIERGCPGAVHKTITAITVEQRNGKWGWVVEVGA